MIIRFDGDGNIKELRGAIAAKFEHTEVLEPVSVLTPYREYRKIIADANNASALEKLVLGHGFTRVTLPPRSTACDDGTALSDADRRNLGEKYYFYAFPERRSFGITKKRVFDDTSRFDASFLGDKALELTLGPSFHNYSEPEWYYNSASDADFIAGYNALLDLGFTELVRSVKTRALKPRDLAKVRAAGAKYYFGRHNEYGSVFIELKTFYDKYGKFNDQFKASRMFETALPPGFHNASESEWCYKNSNDNPADLRIGCGLLLASGFTELPESAVL